MLGDAGCLIQQRKSFLIQGTPISSCVARVVRLSLGDRFRSPPRGFLHLVLQIAFRRQGDVPSFQTGRRRAITLGPVFFPDEWSQRDCEEELL